jgi:hypothetical protein
LGPIYFVFEALSSAQSCPRAVVGMILSTFARFGNPEAR